MVWVPTPGVLAGAVVALVLVAVTALMVLEVGPFAVRTPRAVRRRPSVLDRGSMSSVPMPPVLQSFISFIDRVLDEPELTVPLKSSIDARVCGLGRLSDREHIQLLLRSTMAHAMEKLTGVQERDLQVLAIAERVQSSIVLVHMRPMPCTRAALFFPSHASFRYVLNTLHTARRSIDVCVYTVTDHQILDLLLRAHKHGVRVRIITDDKKAFDAGSGVFGLVEAGIPTVVGEEVDKFQDGETRQRHMHNKFAVVDGSVLLTGSFNWTHAAHDRNCENLLVTDDSYFVTKYTDEFERLWNDLLRENRMGQNKAAQRIQALYRGSSFRKSFSRDSFSRLSQRDLSLDALRNAEPAGVRYTVGEMRTVGNKVRGGGSWRQQGPLPMPPPLAGLYVRRNPSSRSTGDSDVSGRISSKEVGVSESDKELARTSANTDNALVDEVVPDAATRSMRPGRPARRRRGQGSKRGGEAGGDDSPTVGDAYPTVSRSA